MNTLRFIRTVIWESFRYPRSTSYIGHDGRVIKRVRKRKENL